MTPEEAARLAAMLGCGGDATTNAYGLPPETLAERCERSILRLKKERDEFRATYGALRSVIVDALTPR